MKLLSIFCTRYHENLVSVAKKQSNGKLYIVIEQLDLFDNLVIIILELIIETPEIH